MKIFTKDSFSGSLQLVTVDHCTCRNNKIIWSNKQVLMLVDKNGLVLCNAQFRSNATKQAENFLISLGWSVSE